MAPSPILQTLEDLDTFSLAKALAKRRNCPGIMVLTFSLQLLYVNDEARGINGRISKALNGHTAKGVLPPVISNFCLDFLLSLKGKTHPKDGEHLQVRRVLGNAKCPVLVFGVAMPGSKGSHTGRIILIIEEIKGRNEVKAKRVMERFNLTDREQTVVIYLLKGLTNKEIGNKLGITEPTVKEHLRNIMQKTQTVTRTGVLAKVLSEVDDLKQSDGDED